MEYVPLHTEPQGQRKDKVLQTKFSNVLYVTLALGRHLEMQPEFHSH